MKNNSMENLVVDRIPPDVLLAVCLFAGSLVRLGRGETLTPLKSLSELTFGIVVGAGFTGAVIHVMGWNLASGWWVAIASAYFASMIVGIIEKKGEQIRDLSPTATVRLVFREIITEVRKLKTPDSPGPTP